MRGSLTCLGSNLSFIMLSAPLVNIFLCVHPWGPLQWSSIRFLSLLNSIFLNTWYSRFWGSQNVLSYSLIFVSGSLLEIETLHLSEINKSDFIWGWALIEDKLSPIVLLYLLRDAFMSKWKNLEKLLKKLTLGLELQPDAPVRRENLIMSLGESHLAVSIQLLRLKGVLDATFGIGVSHLAL